MRFHATRLRAFPNGVINGHSQKCPYTELDKLTTNYSNEHHECNINFGVGYCHWQAEIGVSDIMERTDPELDLKEEALIC